MNNELIKNAVRCMAVCDAVGADFEFEESPDATKVIKKAKYGWLGITDDTQMTLFGLDSILEGYCIERAYSDWYITQVNSFDEFHYVKNRLLQYKDLWNVRAPGFTCMDSMASIIASGSRDKNNSKGCGSVMRILPCMAIPNITERIDWVKQSIALTHDHPENEVAAGILVRAYSGGEFNRGADKITDYGTGWTAVEAVDMALWAVQNSKTFDELLVNSICHEGDSDSVAAIAGSVWGLQGKSFDYFDRVVESETIEKVLAKM
jgi:ADP-ribosylglycohydrolase